MREIQELSYEEIAQAMGCSLGTVKSRLSRARRTLRCLIESNGEQSNGKLRLLEQKEGNR